MDALSCPCGDVRLLVGARPDFLHQCNCALCTRAGAWWGYLQPEQLAVSGDTGSWRRDDKAEPAAEVHFCPSCLTTTHFVLTPEAIAKVGNTMVGVNFRLADDADLAAIELRYPDGAGWPGEGPFDYVRPSRIL